MTHEMLTTNQEKTINAQWPRLNVIWSNSGVL